MLIDTHCHLDFERFDEDRDEVIARAVEAGVRRIIVPALDLDNCRTVLELAEKYEAVYAAVGVHPNSSAGWEDGWLEQLREAAAHDKVVAIGEIGLDYYWDKSPKEVQQRAFAAQLELAAELDLPVIVHNREADEDVLRLLAESSLREKERPGVLHSFSSNLETAEAAVEMGYYLGFTGPVTYPNANGLREVVARVPMDRILVETDGPFLPPQSRRGKRNEPAYVNEVAAKIAEIRDINVKIVEAMVTENTACLFGRRIVNS